MRSRASKGLSLVLTTIVVSFALWTGTAWAQVSLSPNASPTENNGGWVYQMAVLLGVLGVLTVLLIVFGYMRYAPRFQREEGAQKTVRAPRLVPGREAPRRPVNVTASPVVVPAPAVLATPAAVAAPATPVAAAPVAVSAAPAAATPAPTEAPASAPAEAPVTPAPATAAPGPRPAPPAGERIEVELDQETFEKVLAELLEKGTERRVAEGQARRAAMIAARKKAAGG